MTKANLPPPGTASGLTKSMAYAARFLAAFISIYTLAAVSPAQRTDNVRLYWTGSSGDVWDNSSASWMTTGSFLAYVDQYPNSAVWLTTNPNTGEAIVANPNATFVGGDVVTFDSFTDQGWVWSGSGWRYTLPYPDAPVPDSSASRIIEIASEGVRVSDMVVSGPGSYEFTGGAITASRDHITAGSVQVTGTGTGYATDYVAPGGRLIKRGTGVLTLSNTAANHFDGGIHLFGGVLSITNPNALGDNNIITQYLVTRGNETVASHILGETLMAQMHKPLAEAGNNVLPAVVQNSSGELWVMDTSPARSLHIAPSAAGINITGDIYIGSNSLTFNIDGETTISGRILGNFNNYGAVGGSIIKTGTGALILSGTQNWFYAAGGALSQVNEGRLVATSQYALGAGPYSIDPGAILEFRGVVGTMQQAFVGGGNIEITQRSDVAFHWRYGVLEGFDNVPSTAPANNNIKNIAISGSSRFTAIASGTYTTVLGGASAYVTVADRSTLVVGREGLSARGTGNTHIPMTYAIVANRIDLMGSSTLVLNPNAYLSTGALLVTDDSTCAISFGASGVSRLRWQNASLNPDTITTESDSLRYVVPHGMELYINAIPVPVSSSVPVDGSPEGFCREYVLVNQGAHPLIDIALTMGAINTVHETVSQRLADDFIDPVANLVPTRGRKWVNNAWLRYMHSEFEYESGSISTPGVDGKISGAIAGMNGIIPGRVLLGFYGGMADNRLDTTNATTMESKQRFIGVHAAQKLGKFYISIDATTGKVRTDSIRNEPNASVVRARWDTSYYSGALQVGTVLSPWQQTTLKPYAGLRYSKMKFTNYEERCDSPLMLEDLSDTCSQVIYGLAASRKFVLFKRDLAIDASIGRKQTISAPVPELETSYFDAPDTPVTLRRGDYYASLTTLGLSARAAITSNTQIGLSAEYETSSSRTNTTLSAVVGYSW